MMSSPSSILKVKIFPLQNLKAALRAAVIANKAAPVFCGSSLRNKGVQPLLDAMIEYLPSPADVAAVTGINPNNDEEVTRVQGDDEPMSALVFKIVTDPYVGRLAYLRVYSGKVSPGLNHSQLHQRKEGTGWTFDPHVC